MKIKSQNDSVKAEADLTPMIDMVFQLLAFFMVLINFSQSDQNSRVATGKSDRFEFGFQRQCLSWARDFDHCRLKTSARA